MITRKDEENYMEAVAAQARKAAGEALLDLAGVVRFGSPEDLPGALDKLEIVKLHLKDAISNLEMAEALRAEREEQGFANWREMGQQ